MAAQRITKRDENICYRTFEPKSLRANELGLTIISASQNGGVASSQASVTGITEGSIYSGLPCHVRGGSGLSQITESNRYSVKQRVNSKSPKAFLKAACRYCFDACAYFAADRNESDNYRIAATALEFVRSGESTPVEAAYALLDTMLRKHGTGPYAPRVGVVADLAQAANMARTKAIASGVVTPPRIPQVPTEIDGRTARQWRASVVAYLQWRVDATCSSRADRLKSAYHDALCIALNPPAATVAKATTVAAQFPVAVKIPASSKEAKRA